MKFPHVNVMPTCAKGRAKKKSPLSGFDIRDMFPFDSVCIYLFIFKKSKPKSHFFPLLIFLKRKFVYNLLYCTD